MSAMRQSVWMPLLVLGVLSLAGQSIAAQPAGPPEGKEPGSQRGGPRAALGISIAGLEGRGDGGRDEGVLVVGVNPGGPAANAGVQSGDVLVSVDGKALKSADGRSPQQVLMEHMRTVDPGDTVALEYRREGKTAKADLVAQPFNPPAYGGFMEALPLPDGWAPGILDPGRAFLRGAGVFGGLELVPMTPKLGQYFGTEKGLLVLRAPRDSRLGLEEGDVIVDIAGRIPAGADHATRILGSYQAGEKLTINVMRMKKKIAVNIDVPDGAGRGAARFERRVLPPGRDPAGDPVPFNGPEPRRVSPPPRSPERA